VTRSTPDWVLCDLDGTLVDSSNVLRRAYDGFLADRGSIGDDDEFADLVGPALPEIVHRLRDRHRLEEPFVALLADYHDRVSDAYQGVRPCEGAHSFIAGVSAQGCRLALVTSAPRVLAHRALDGLRWTDEFPVIVCGDEVDRAKPASDLYEVALRQAGCSPERAVAVEDSPHGVSSARGAGLTVLAVHGSFSPDVRVIPVGDLAGALAWIVAQDG
jgi:HAD superfamily hydrolase (TIGR01509 family)